LLVGGKAKRMNNEIKCLKEINGITLLERTIKQYSDCGFRKFNILAGFGYQEIQDYIKNKSTHAKKINPSFSLDDPSWRSAGKGKALKQALKNGTIDKSKRSVIAYPDDILIGDTIPIDIITAHLGNTKSYVTVVTTPGTEYPFGEVIVDDLGKVKSFVEKPFVSKITSTGLYVIEPPVYTEIDTLIDLASIAPQEFEKVVLEKIARDGKISNYTIPSDSWISVNTSKEFEAAKSRLEN
jgi:NDP-sugar pyrophosphorylase family protein